MPRRKAGTLLPLEVEILGAGLGLQRAGEPFHGFALASEIARGTEDARPLTAHGTLYKALARLAEAGLLAAEWEDPTVSETEGRPRRRLYTVTPDGAVALAAARATASRPATAQGSVAAQGLA